MQNNESFGEVKTSFSNPYYTKILQDLFAGEKGKIISFLQFSYQSNILKPFNKQLASVLESLAENELSNAKILAQNIIFCGGNPQYKSSKEIFLGGRSVCYAKNTASIVDEDITLKEQSIIAYKNAIQKIGNTKIKHILFQILRDEENQKSTLETLKNNIKNINSN